MSEAFLKIDKSYEISNIANTGNTYDDIINRVETIRHETDQFLQKVLDENKNLIIKQNKKEEIEEDI